MSEKKPYKLSKEQIDKYYNKHHASKEQMKERAARNRARNDAIKNGSVKKGDGKEIAHIDRNPLNNSPSNKRVVSHAFNHGRPKKKK